MPRTVVIHSPPPNFRRSVLTWVSRVRLGHEPSQICSMRALRVTIWRGLEASITSRSNSFLLVSIGLPFSETRHDVATRLIPLRFYPSERQKHIAAPHDCDIYDIRVVHKCVPVPPAHVLLNEKRSRNQWFRDRTP